MTDFINFSIKVNERLETLPSNTKFFSINGRELWKEYLAAFPEGTDPLFITNTKHNCNCCNSFIRNLGNIIVFDNDGNKQTIWDIEGLEYPYDVIASRMHELVLNTPIRGVLTLGEDQYGTQTNLGEKEGIDKVFSFNHFFGDTPELSSHEINTSAKSLKRAFEEFKEDDVELVLDLCESNEIYLGETFTHLVSDFLQSLKEYNNTDNKVDFIWMNAHKAISRFRNTVIGTLIQDIAGGDDLEVAVKKYEAKTAPTNYKRSSAVVSVGMAKKMAEQLDKAGLRTAIERRHATLEDVSVNDILWVDSSVKNIMKDSVDDMLDSLVSTPKKTKQTKDISIKEFIENVLPKLTSLEVLAKNSLSNKLMTLTAPTHEDTGKLFKWDNDFAWSYNGNVTDSIREKVKSKGGNVDAKLRFSIEWFNRDDLDIHVRTPSGKIIYYGNRQGILDIDANGGDGIMEDPVENMAFTNPEKGIYTIEIHNYQKRDTLNNGFNFEYQCGDISKQFSYTKDVKNRERIQVLKCQYENGTLTVIESSKDLTEDNTSKQIWNIETEKFAKVNTVMLSPNFWNEQSLGNKHWFFLLEDCENPDSVQGFYNEYLNDSLKEHRKALELLGNRTRIPYNSNQLSGLGFSSSIPAQVTFRTNQGEYNVSI